MNLWVMAEALCDFMLLLAWVGTFTLMGHQCLAVAGAVVVTLQ